MRQVTLRLDGELADRLKHEAVRRGQSVNGYAQLVLRAAVDPDTADGEAAQLRERLAQAGLLARAMPRRDRPPETEVADARRAAGQGRSLADIVGEDRR